MQKGIDRNYSYHLIAVAVMGLLCGLIYFKTLSYGFVFDDFYNIRNNPHIRLKHLDYQKLYNAGFKNRLPNRPVANISFALNYYVGKYDVTGYRIVNIIIHLINGILVYFLALVLFTQSSRLPDQETMPIQTGSISLMSLFASLIFIAHPVQTQSVTYIVQRMNSMAAMFYLLAMLLYIQGRLSRLKFIKWGLFCGCFVSWVMALGSKEIAGTLPLVILLYEWYFFQNLKADGFRQNKKYIIALLAVLAVIAFVYLGKRPLNTVLGSYALRDFTMSERVLTQFRVVLFYISLLLFPHPSRLNLLHFFSISHSLVAPLTTLLSLLSVIGLIAYAVYISKKQRLLSFIILWFFIHLSIESSVIGLEIIFEHRLYLPLFAFAVLTAYLLFGLFANKQRRVVFISLLIVLSLGTAGYVRNRVWQNETTLWSDVIAKNPKSHRAHYNLGVFLKEQGRLKEAAAYFFKAVKIKPDDAEAHNNLGSTLVLQGRYKEAVEHLSEALRIKPDYAGVHNNLGVALKKQGRLKEATVYFFKAVKIKPDYAEAHNNLGNVLAIQGRRTDAIAHFSEALRINPDYATAHYNLGITLQLQGKIKEANIHLLRARQLTHP